MCTCPTLLNVISCSCCKGQWKHFETYGTVLMGLMYSLSYPGCSIYFFTIITLIQIKLRIVVK